MSSAAQVDVDAPRIGARLKEARLKKRLTLDALAYTCGVTKGYLSKLERDQVNASVASLVRVCAALDVPVGSLFDDAPVGEVVRAQSLPRIMFGGEQMTEYLLTPVGERRVQVLLGHIEHGGGSGPEAYTLPLDVSFVYVIDGELRVIFEADPGADFGGDDISLGAGDAFTFSPRRRHSFRSDSSGGARVLWVLAPALPEELPIGKPGLHR
ncbi:MAG: XRE family transcriptional regulator [Rhodococcus sp.]|uniref:helix-turn-helix domain-containing protein n=1 Tax=Nocardiaceae TaxID=85025 RepID=UPI00050CB9A4|nr:MULTISPECIES: XRE family transcriptional regulator [Rhodococcus]KJV00214.1 putative Xre family DNA-binding protein [Rhodococcus sp. PML026]MCX6492432.1 XRE family transcriptional regulator [Rhodococcus sp. (in: high G+C Gram-positive bacteria)]WQH26963.1 XRE family transcriptional regulator [Rhodococcus fascians]